MLTKINYWESLEGHLIGFAENINEYKEMIKFIIDTPLNDNAQLITSKFCDINRWWRLHKDAWTKSESILNDSDMSWGRTPSKPKDNKGVKVKSKAANNNDSKKGNLKKRTSKDNETKVKKNKKRKKIFGIGDDSSDSTVPTKRRRLNDDKKISLLHADEDDIDIEPSHNVITSQSFEIVDESLNG